MTSRTTARGRRFAEPRRRTNHRIGLAVGLGAVLAALAIGPAATVALWSDTVATADLTANRATFGFSVARGAVVDIATSGADTVALSFGTAEAETMLAAGPDANGQFGLAVPFDVTMATSAGYGLDYAMALPQPGSTSVLGLGGASPSFFRVSDPSGCTVAAAELATAYTSGTTVTGLDPASTAPETLVHHWCAVFTITPPQYENTAQASGTDALGRPITSAATPEASWMAYVVPDPATEPTTSVTLSPSVHAGCPA